MTPSLEKIFRETITRHELLPPHRPVVVAVSGGPDSLCLLHLVHLLQPAPAIHAVYVDHNLRPDETAAEKRFIVEQCETLGCTPHLRFVDVPQEVAGSGESIEACARRLRYQELEELRRSVGSEVIAVGHTADDQAEEILIRLIRGSGLKGLSGMSHQSEHIVRPLLDISKADILAYLTLNHIEFCHDSSNDSRDFLRNRVRIDLLPLLEEQFNPSIRKTLIKTAAILKDEDDYLHGETTRVFNSVVRPAPAHYPADSSALSLTCNGLTELHRALARRIIEMVLWKLDGRPDSAAIEKIMGLARNGPSGTELHLPDRIRVVREENHLLITRLPAELDSRQSLHQFISVDQQVSGPGTYECAPLGKKLIIGSASHDLDEEVDTNLTTGEPALLVDGSKLSFPLSLRTVQPGERFRPERGAGSRKIARYLNDRKIPRQQRHRYPLLISNNEVVCVLGLSVDAGYSPVKTTAQAVSIHWLDLP